MVFFALAGIAGRVAKVTLYEYLLDKRVLTC